MKIDYKDHYNDEYWTRKKTYRDGDGVERIYQGPSVDWSTGWPDISNVLAQLLPKGKLLDIGCGGGGLSARLRDKGFDSYGLDVSEYAADNAVDGMLGRIEVGDVTEYARSDSLPWGIDQWDAIVATDFPEHVYLEDINDTFSYLKKLLRPGGVAFFLVATNNVGDEPFFHVKGAEVPLRWETTAVSGHVSVSDWRFWTKKFRELGWEIRWDLRCLYQQMREQIDWWKTMDAWRLSNAFFLS